jgi:hypothetical protein
MNPHLKTALWGLAAGILVVTVLLIDTPSPQRPQTAVTQPVQAAPEKYWIVVLVSWENRAPIDEKFKTYEDCRFYMVNAVLPIIAGKSDTYAKCEERS